MWIFFLTAAAAIVIAVVVHAAASSARDRILRDVETEEMAVLEATKMRVTGPALGTFTLEGEYGGVALRLTSPVRRMPPNETDDDLARTALVVSTKTALSDRIVCRETDASRILGAAPYGKLATESVRFDQRFVTDAGHHRGATAYRAAADDGARFLTAEIAERLVDLDLYWIQIKEHSLELVFAPMRASSVERALAVTANIARVASGRPELPIRSGPADHSDPMANIGSAPSVLRGAAFVALLGTPFGAALAFLPPVRSSMDEVCCGKGDVIEVTSSEEDDGTSYGLSCRDHPEATVLPAYLLAISIWASFVLVAGLLLAASRWPKRAT